MVKLLFFYFRVTNSNLKNIKWDFELQFRLMLEIQFYFCHVPPGDHQEKTSLYFWSFTKSNYYLYIINSHCSQSLFSKLNLLVTRKPGTQN